MRWPSHFRAHDAALPMRHRLAQHLLMPAKNGQGSPVWTPRGKKAARETDARAGQVSSRRARSISLVCTTSPWATSRSVPSVSRPRRCRRWSRPGPGWWKRQTCAPLNELIEEITGGPRRSRPRLRRSSCGCVPGLGLGAPAASSGDVVADLGAKRTGAGLWAREAGTDLRWGREQGLLCGTNPTLPATGRRVLPAQSRRAYAAQLTAASSPKCMLLWGS